VEKFWFDGGGFIMYPLLICSILVWTVAIEKFWFLYNFSRRFRSLHQRLMELSRSEKIHEAKGLCLSAPPVMTGVYNTLFEDLGRDSVLWEQRVGRRFSEALVGMKRFMWVL